MIARVASTRLPDGRWQIHAQDVWVTRPEVRKPPHFQLVADEPEGASASSATRLTIRRPFCIIPHPAEGERNKQRAEVHFALPPRREAMA